MEINCRVLVVTLVCLCLTLHQVSAAVWHGKGCGADRKAGDKWFVDPCAVCRCYPNDDYSCYSCGVSRLAPRKDCYVDYEDRSALYPICCSKGYVCKGNPRFDSKKFEDYWKNEIIG